MNKVSVEVFNSEYFAHEKKVSARPLLGGGGGGGGGLGLE